MRPVLVELGPLALSSFATTMSLAFVVAGFVMQRDFARKGVPGDLAWTIVVAGMIGGLVGAHGEFVLQHWHQVRQAPLVALTSWSGMVWYGGVLGGIVGTAWPIRRAGIPWASAADTAAPALAIGLAIARIGCHLAGDGDWGTPTALPWRVAYTHGVSPWPHPPGVGVHPAALYESLALAVVFVVLWRLRVRVRPAGALFALYLLLSGGIRFLVECIRTNQPVLLSLTEAQWISIVLAAGGTWWLARATVPRQAPSWTSRVRAAVISGAAGLRSTNQA